MKTCKDCPFHEIRKKPYRTVSKGNAVTRTEYKYFCNYRNHEVSRLMRCYVVDNPSRYLKTQSTPEVTFIED